MTKVLELQRVTVALRRNGRLVPVVQDVSLRLAQGQTLALVGESGSGKTTLALSIPRLLPPGATVSGRIEFLGRELGPLAEKTLRVLCGARIGIVFQDALAALNPALQVGEQIAESIRLHLRQNRRAAWLRAVSLLDEVGIAQPARRAADYPHMFSGGMRQRVMIAAALACNPALLIADEPTSGLDPARTGQILALLDRLRAERGMAVLLISHDLELMARHADQVAVMYAGACVEHGPAADVLRAPLHRYTRALLAATPRMGGAVPAAIPGTLPPPGAWPTGCRFAPRCRHAAPPCLGDLPPVGIEGHRAACAFPAAGAVPPPAASQSRNRPPAETALLRVDALGVRYGAASVLRDVSFSVAPGECLGVVGASGSGKTTLGRAVLGLTPYTGTVTFEQQDLASLRAAPRRVARRRMQAVFQDPASSLDPMQSVAQAIGEALLLGGLREPEARRERVIYWLGQVGLTEDLLDRAPASISGGQAQRVAIARALAAEPALLVLDEPTASLDVSSAAGLLALLRDLAARLRLAYIVITHDPAVASVLAHRVMELKAEGTVLF